MKDLQLLDQKVLVDAFLNQGDRSLSGFSFVSIFAWCDYFDFEFKTIGNCLCIFAHGQAGCFLYLPPLGKNLAASTIYLAFKHMSQGGDPKPVNRIENIPGNLLSSFPQGSYNQYLRPAEYVYRKEDLVTLKGNAYKSQRHECNNFMAKQGQLALEPYSNDDLFACMELYERWADDRASTNSDEIYRSMLIENRQVHARLLKFWEPLGLIVRVLKKDKRLIGYTFGFVLDDNTFCLYAEIVDLEIPGTAAYMFRSFCADEQLKIFSRINTMDDFAMPKVARAKESYHPSEMVDSYSVSLKI